jgi:hypothetical protein
MLMYIMNKDNYDPQKEYYEMLLLKEYYEMHTTTRRYVFICDKCKLLYSMTNIGKRTKIVYDDGTTENKYNYTCKGCK